MSIFETILLGIGLSMDACAVCISNALVYPVLSGRAKRSMPLCFGFFQGVMPLIGYWAGTFCAQFIRLYAGSVTFFILCFIGGKMILDSFLSKKEEEEARPAPSFTFSLLLLQAVATSLDALAVGIGFCAMEVSLFRSALLIACTTFFCCLLAVSLGSRVGRFLSGKATVLGGILLILLGVKSLFC